MMMVEQSPLHRIKMTRTIIMILTVIMIHCMRRNIKWSIEPRKRVGWSCRDFWPSGPWNLPSGSSGGPARLWNEPQSEDWNERLNGPLKSCIAQLKAALNEIEHSIAIEEQGFRAIVDGADVEFEEVRDKAPDNWYIGCKEAAERGLIAGVI